MDSLTYTFNLETREQFASLFRRIALAIPPILIHENQLPIIICLTGNARTGKSAVWDEMKEALLGNTATKDPNTCVVSDKGVRVRETWMGTHSLSKKAITMTFCNLADSYFDEEDIRLCLTNFHRPHFSNLLPKHFGDFLILSNEEVAKASMCIELTAPNSVRDQDWRRRISVIIKDPDLTNPEILEILDQHCMVA